MQHVEKDDVSYLRGGRLIYQNISDMPLKRSDGSKTICLMMIVKQEEKTIGRALRSTPGIIDYFVISDTGSTDGTLEEIKKAAEELNIPGQVYSHQWENFGHNRNNVLSIAKTKCDYSLVLDADEQFFTDPSIFDRTKITEPAYFLKMKYPDFSYDRCDLVRNDMGWNWVGVLHEVMIASKPCTPIVLEGLWNTPKSEGSRSIDPNKYQKDALVLKKAILDEPNNSRYMFYIAQSYRDAGKHKHAQKWYLKRSTKGGFLEEVVLSLMEVGSMLKYQGKSFTEYSGYYLLSYSKNPSRLEGLYHYVVNSRCSGVPVLGYEMGKGSIDKGLPEDQKLFLVPSIYSGNLKWEVARCAAECNKTLDAIKWMLELKRNPNVEAFIRRSIRCLTNILKKNDPLITEKARVTRSRRWFVAYMVDSSIPMYMESFKTLLMQDTFSSNVQSLHIYCKNGIPKTLTNYIKKLIKSDSDTASILKQCKFHIFTEGPDTKIYHNMRTQALGHFMDDPVTENMFVMTSWSYVNRMGLSAVYDLLEDERSEKGTNGIHSLLLRHVPGVGNDRYTNFFGAVDANGYLVETAEYNLIINMIRLGSFDMPLVHSNYGLTKDTCRKIMEHPYYTDPNDNVMNPMTYEPVSFSNYLRSVGVKQYIVNVCDFGRIIRPGHIKSIHPSSSDADINAQKTQVVKLLKIMQKHYNWSFLHTNGDDTQTD